MGRGEGRRRWGKRVEVSCFEGRYQVYVTYTAWALLGEVTSLL